MLRTIVLFLFLFIAAQSIGPERHYAAILLAAALCFTILDFLLVIRTGKGIIHYIKN